MFHDSVAGEGLALLPDACHRCGLHWFGLRSRPKLCAGLANVALSPRRELHFSGAAATSIRISTTTVRASASSF